MSHRPGHDGIAEILASGQFPGTVIKGKVRSAVLRDAAGQSTRVILGGADTSEAERQMISAAEQDGLDLRTARMEVVSEEGQGFGRKASYKPNTLRRLPKPRYPKALPAVPV